jgi:hypothetical protein
MSQEEFNVNLFVKAGSFFYRARLKIIDRENTLAYLPEHQ